MKHKKLLGGLAMIAMAGCSDAKFSSQKTINNNDSPPGEVISKKEGIETIKITCAEQEKGLGLQRTLSNMEGKKLIIEGEICHQSSVQNPSKPKLNMTFMVDTSGSMRENDPFISSKQSCGRLDAIKAIIAKVKSNASTEMDLKVGIVGFNGQAYTILNLQAESLNDINASQVCFSNDKTNYEDGFGKVEGILKNETGRHAIFLLSDGMPTKANSGNETLAASLGLESAKKLRNNVKESSLFAVYLNSSSAQNPQEVEGFNSPEDYLIAVTGDKTKVKIVNNASEFATGIVTFEIPKAIDSQLQTPTLNLEVEGQKTMSIKVNKFEKVKNNTWMLTSDVFSPIIKKGFETKNVVHVKSKTSDGSEKNIVLEITVK